MEYSKFSGFLLSIMSLLKFRFKKTPLKIQTNDFYVKYFQVKSLGYVSIGFSPNGGMKGADIIIAWMENGKVFLEDRFAGGNSIPIKDSRCDIFTFFLK